MRKNHKIAGTDLETRIVEQMKAGVPNKSIRQQFKLASSSVSNIRRRWGINYKARNKAAQPPEAHPVAAVAQPLSSGKKSAITKALKKQVASRLVAVPIDGSTLMIPKDKIIELYAKLALGK